MQYGGAISGFGRWWLAELAASIPSSVRERVWPSPETVIIRPEGERLALAVRRRGEAAFLEYVPLDPTDAEATGKALRSSFRRRRISATSLVIELGSSQALEPTLDLPVEASSRLDEVLRSEIDRLTPFTAEEACFDFRVTGSDDSLKRLTIRMWVARKCDVDQLIRIAASAGLKPDLITVAGSVRSGGGGSPVNFLPEHLRAKGQGRVSLRPPAGLPMGPRAGARGRWAHDHTAPVYSPRAG